MPGGMSDPAVTGDPVDPARCERCLQTHDPRHCIGHVDECTACEWRTGNHVDRPCVKCEAAVRLRPCRRFPTPGVAVCASHGSRAQQVRAAGERTLIEEGATKELGKAIVRPIGDPIVALGDLAAEAVAMLEVAKANAAGGAVDGPWMALLERSLERAGKLLAAAGRLGLEERRVRLEEAQLDLVAAVITGTLRRLGIDVDSAGVQEALDATYTELEAAAVQ